MKQVAALVAILLLPVAVAQEPLHLGDDATGDASLLGESHPDTWVDITNMYVFTDGEDLVFHLGLRGTTTELGQYCFMAAFEFKGKELVGLDCFEGVAYQNNNAVSGVSRPDTSRGENVAGTEVSFNADSAVIRVPFAGFGAKIGDVIDDIYGLTYNTRALIVADTIPDAKSSANADENLGSYVLGADFLGLPEPEVPIEAPGSIFENATGGFERVFDNSTGTINVNWTATAPNATYQASWNITAGNATVKVVDGANVTLLEADLMGAGTLTTPELGANQTYTIMFTASQATGSFAWNQDIEAESAPVGNETTQESDGDEKVEESPGLPMLAVSTAMLALAILRRRQQ